MNVLLDTCALLALARGDLPKRAAAALRSAPEAIVSAVSPWEVTPEVTKAVSGVAWISPWPVICMLPEANAGDTSAVAKTRGSRAGKRRIEVSLCGPARVPTDAVTSKTLRR